MPYDPDHIRDVAVETAVSYGLTVPEADEIADDVVDRWASAAGASDIRDLVRETVDEHARRVTVGLRVDRRTGGHVEVSLFAGRNRHARGRSGGLVFRIDEWDEIVAGLPERWEVIEPVVEVRAEDLQVDDVLDAGGMVTTAPSRHPLGWVAFEIDYRMMLTFPAGAPIRIHRREADRG